MLDRGNVEIDDPALLERAKHYKHEAIQRMFTTAFEMHSTARTTDSSPHLDFVDLEAKVDIRMRDLKEVYILGSGAYGEVSLMANKHGVQYGVKKM